MERRIHDFIPEIKDLYTINDKGEVFSDNSGRMKTRYRAGSKYKIINFMTEDGQKRTFRVHRLVATAFLPNPQNKKEVNHIDGNKENNSLENLEWSTRQENAQHAVDIGLMKPRRGEDCSFSILTEEQVREVFTLREQGLLQREIAEIMNCSSSNISYILRGKTWRKT